MLSRRTHTFSLTHIHSLLPLALPQLLCACGCSGGFWLHQPCEEENRGNCKPSSMAPASVSNCVARFAVASKALSCRPCRHSLELLDPAVSAWSPTLLLSHAAVPGAHWSTLGAGKLLPLTGSCACYWKHRTTMRTPARLAVIPHSILAADLIVGLW